MSSRSDNVIELRKYPGGAAAGVRSVLCNGRFEVSTAGPNSEFGFVKSDPYKTNAGTGLVVPSTPSASIGNVRYLFLLAWASFGAGENNGSFQGARLVGIRQYAELVARLPARTAPLATGSGPATGSTVTFRKEITSPLWHPQDGNISWHVMVIPKGQRDTRNPANTDGFIFQTATSPALLYQTGAPSGAGYTPPNGGRPWGKAIGSSLGNIHDLRYRWREEDSEYALDIPIPVACDVALFASVRQNDPSLNPVFAEGVNLTQQFMALGPEDQFVSAYPTVAQYGVIAGALIFDQNIGSDVP